MNYIRPAKVLFATAMGRSQQALVASAGQFYMATELNKRGIQTRFFPIPLKPEGHIEANPRHRAEYLASTQLELGKAIKDFEPTVLAVSLLDENLVITQEYLRWIKEGFPDILIAAGGIFPTAFPDYAQVHLGEHVDIFCTGEADFSFPRLLTSLDKPVELAKIAGVRVRIEGEVLVDTLNHAYKLTEEEFNALEPDYQLMKEDIERGTGIRLITSRGCRRPTCSFCLADIVQGKVIKWSAEKIVREMLKIRDLIEAGELGPNAKKIIMDDLDFIQDRDRAIAFFRLFRKHGLDTYFKKLKIVAGAASFFNIDNAGKTAQAIDAEMLFLLSSISQNLELEIEIGADFYTDAGLKRNKGNKYSIEHIKVLTRELKKREIPFVLATIFTDEQSEIAEWVQTLKTMDGLWKHFFGTGHFEIPHRVTVAYFGTRLYKRTIRSGEPAFADQILSKPGFPEFDYPLLSTPKLSPLLFYFLSDPATQQLWRIMRQERECFPLEILILLREFLNVQMEKASPQGKTELRRLIDEIGEEFRSIQHYEEALINGPDNAYKAWFLEETRERKV